jgi:hypothetical protein
MSGIETAWMRARRIYPGDGALEDGARMARRITLLVEASEDDRTSQSDRIWALQEAAYLGQALQGLSSYVNAMGRWMG